MKLTCQIAVSLMACVARFGVVMNHCKKIEHASMQNAQVRT